MKWNAYPVLRLFIPFAAGIIFYDKFPGITISFWWIFPLVILNFVFAFIRKWLPSYRYRGISTLPIFLTYGLLGFYYAFYFYPYSNNDYVGKQTDKVTVWMVKIDEEPSRTKKSVKIRARMVSGIDSTGKTKADGFVQLYLPIDTQSLQLEYGDLLVINNRLQPALPPQNPYEFDYRKYLYRQGIQYTAYLPAGDWIKARNNKKTTLKGLALKARNAILRQLKKNGITDEKYAVAASLLLGYKEDLSDDLLNAYRTAGVMHVLCVSGLHVGIIYMILSYLLRFMNKTKRGRKWRVLIIFIHIWGFAFITGLSPSVTRSSVMFSLILLAQYMKRDNRLYNTLSLAALITLLINPFYLFNIGFILSYSAVLGIDMLYQPINELLFFHRGWLNTVWKLSSVSIAAQIGTAPVAIYFFHQFPNYFLLSNLIVMPLVFVAFYAALASLVLSFLPLLASFFGWITSEVIWLLNYSVTGIRSLPLAISDHIPIAAVTLILIYLLIFQFVYFWENRREKTLIWSAGTVLVILIFSLVKNYEREGVNELVAFKVPKHTTIILRKGRNALMLTDSVAYKKPESIAFHVSGYINHDGLKVKSYDLDKDYPKDLQLWKMGDFLLSAGKVFCFNTEVLSHNMPVSKIDYLVLRDKKQYHFALDKGIYNIDKVLISNEIPKNRANGLAMEIGQEGYNCYNLNNSPAFVDDL